MFQVISDGKQVISVQGLGAPFPIYETYPIYWYILIGLPFHNIFPVLPPIQNFVSALEGDDTNQDCVSCPQGHCLTTFIIISFMAAHLLCWNRSAFLWAHLMHSLSFWMYLMEVGAATNIGVNPKVMSMGSWDWLPYIRN